jgi:hypothetical protein
MHSPRAMTKDLRGVNPHWILRGPFVRRVRELAARRGPNTAAEMVDAMRVLASPVLAADESDLPPKTSTAAGSLP